MAPGRCEELALSYKNGIPAWVCVLLQFVLENVKLLCGKIVSIIDLLQLVHTHGTESCQHMQSIWWFSKALNTATCITFAQKRFPGLVDFAPAITGCAQMASMHMLPNIDSIIKTYGD